MSIEFLSILFVAVFAVTLLTGLPLAFATGAVAVVFAVVLFGMPGLTLIWFGGSDAWNSFSIGETTSTPWNPVIWPVKAAIPAAGLLLLLQGFSNLFRDLGWVQGGQSR